MSRDGTGSEKRKKLPARRHRSFGEHRYVVLAYTRRRRVAADDIPTSITPVARIVNGGDSVARDVPAVTPPRFRP